MWVPAFACPTCRGPLPSDGDEYACPGCHARFTCSGGVLRFATPAKLAATGPFLDQYRQVRRADGHIVRSTAAYRALPETSDTDISGEWAIRRQSFRTICRQAGLARGRSNRVLDVGAGNGWLSNRLATLGHAPVAVDLNDDAEDGLAAASAAEHSFAKVQADFDALPFVPGQFDVAVLNASLHYSDDPAQTLAEANRMITSNGTLVVMDSPMFERAADGEGMVRQQAEQLRVRYGVAEPIRAGVGYLTFALLRQGAAELGRVASFFPSRGSLGWRARRAWARRRIGRAPAAFGVWVAR